MKFIKDLFRKKTQDELMAQKIDAEMTRYIKIRKSIKDEIKRLSYELIMAEKMIKANQEILMDTKEIIG